jgi:membrane protein required for colicin V production
MQAYDLLMLVIVGLAIVWGAWKGLVWQIASIASIGLSYFVALNFRQQIAQLIDASPPWNMFLSMLILFLGTGFMVWIAFNLVSEFIERVKLQEFDRQLGALFGAAKGVLLCALVTLFSVALLGDAQRQAICNSKSGYYIAIMLDRADLVIPRELHDVLAPYLDRLDRTIPHPHASGASTPLQSLFSDAQARLEQEAGRLERAAIDQRDAWQRELRTAVERAASGTAPAAGSSFPTGDWLAPATPASGPHTARRIDAQPAPAAAAGSFRQ